VIEKEKDLREKNSKIEEIHGRVFKISEFSYFSLMISGKFILSRCLFVNRKKLGLISLCMHTLIS